jgi:hypothetical protein
VSLRGGLRWAFVAVLTACTLPGSNPGVAQYLVPFPIVFVSRQIPPRGSVYWDVPRDLPGVGAWSRFRPAAPGRLLVREPDGRIRTLVNGGSPSASSLHLIDVNAPDVSYDGRTIVFAGLPDGPHDQAPGSHPGAWRLYAINVDGTGLRQITRSDQQLDMAQFGTPGQYLRDYDDTDPTWLPDGRIVFSSTRWPAFAQYSGVRATNLFVVNADGSDWHRITSERNGADRPLIDPITGKIVFARWWRNHRFGTDDLSTVIDPKGGYAQREGLTVNRSDHAGGPDALWRNFWQIATINPDGSELALWAGAFRSEPDNHFYGGAFSDSGELYGNFFPMFNMSEASGFGGIRRWVRGPGLGVPVAGVTSLTQDYVSRGNPTSYGIYKGTYAAEPEVLPDGRLVVGWADDVMQDYGLFSMNPDGSARVPLFDLPESAEVRPRTIRARPLPPVLTERATRRTGRLPPTSDPATFFRDGTFVFHALNVYANAPVDTDIVSAPAVGSAGSIRFFLDHQRTSPGSFPNLDWPILLATVPVSAEGMVRHEAPAGVPLFEQLRTSAGTVPLTPGQYRTDGAAHVAGMNYSSAGVVARCVGCHAGHSMMAVPATDEQARWTNLAPGAAVTVSSTRDAARNRSLIDRRALKGEVWRFWASQREQTSNQWVLLVFPAPILVRNVRLYNPRHDPETSTDLSVQATRVTLYQDDAASRVAAVALTGPLSVTGTDVPFRDVRARAVRVLIEDVTGHFEGMQSVSLAEVEVIAAGDVSR